MPKATVPFGEWRPDLALLDNQYASIADNVFTSLNSYQPCPSLIPILAASLPEQPALGVFGARHKDGTWEIFVGTAHHIYLWSWHGWTDVTRTTGGNYNVPGGELWSWTQFGSTVIAVQFGDVPQAFDIETGTAFAALGGSPPQAHNVQVIGDFVVLGSLLADLPGTPINSGRSTILWSGINNPTQWSPGSNLCDFQFFPDGGPVQGVAGNETVAYVVQDRVIRLMQFLPGDINNIFNFTKILHDRGAVGEFCFRTIGDVFYFINEDGFYALAGGSQLLPIGQDKVNNWFIANSDRGRRNMYQVVPTNRPYVAWAYYETAASPIYDRLIIYNWANQKWSTGTVGAAVWGLLATHYIDLDTDVAGDPLDPQLDSTDPGLDSFAYVGGRPFVCGINVQGQLCSLDGPPLPATLETAEAHLVPGQRAFVSEVYPLIDGTSNPTPTLGPVVCVATRERLGDQPRWSISGQVIGAAIPPSVDQIPLEVTGKASVLTSSLLHRFRILIPANETWSNAQGVLAEVQPDGYA